MTKHEIIKTIDSVKKGTFVRIVYQSELPLTAAAKKAGHVIVKHTEKVVRLGVNYGNIAKVQEAEAETDNTMDLSPEELAVLLEEEKADMRERGMSKDNLQGNGS